MARPGIKVVANFKQALTADKVVYNRYGKHFGFYVSPKGTTVANQVGTPTGNIDTAQLKADIEAMQGTAILNNPKYDDVKTDTDGDGVNDTGDYNWVEAGQLYTVTEVADLDA